MIIFVVNFTMKTPKVLVLAGESLLTQGLIANLRKSSVSLEVETLDLDRADLIEAVASRAPDIIVLESPLSAAPDNFPFNRFFEILPRLIILEVNLNKSSVQIIRSDLYEAPGFAGFLDVIQTVNSNPNGLFAPLSALTHE